MIFELYYNNPNNKKNDWSTRPQRRGSWFKALDIGQIILIQTVRTNSVMEGVFQEYDNNGQLFISFANNDNGGEWIHYSDPRIIQVKKNFIQTCFFNFWMFVVFYFR